MLNFADSFDFEPNDQTSNYGKDGSRGGNVEFAWKIEEGEAIVFEPGFELMSRSEAPVEDDVIVDGNIITAESYDSAW